MKLETQILTFPATAALTEQNKVLWDLFPSVLQTDSKQTIMHLLHSTIQ